MFISGCSLINIPLALEKLNSCIQLAHYNILKLKTNNKLKINLNLSNNYTLSH